MLIYLTTAEAMETVECFYNTWGRGLASQIDRRSYEDVATCRRLPLANYFFSDLERLSDEGLERADRLWSALNAAAPDLHLGNRPAHHLRRRILLEKLYENGFNKFTVYPATEPPLHTRFPVFVRYANEHWGPMTDLLRTPSELRRALRRAVLIGHRLRDLLVVEFCDTSLADGIYRKYGAYIVEGRVVPRHIFCSRHWTVRNSDLVDEAKLAEERAYLEENPHRQELEAIAALASVDYGRFDYGLADGRVQIFEINSNPLMMRNPETYAEERLPNQLFFAEMMLDHIRPLAAAPIQGELDLPVDWTDEPWPTRSSARTTRRARVAGELDRIRRESLSRTHLHTFGFRQSRASEVRSAGHP